MLHISRGLRVPGSVARNTGELDTEQPNQLNVALSHTRATRAKPVATSRMQLIRFKQMKMKLNL